MYVERRDDEKCTEKDVVLQVLSPEYILNILQSNCGYNHGETLLCGCSGGKDSVALVHLLHAAKIPLAVAHVNYNLRGDESTRDEHYVTEFCAKVGLPLYVRQTSIEELNAIDSNLQQAARKLRYTFFEEIIRTESISYIATAHHSEDQLETVLMHFLRGSGLRGVTGMLFRNETIIRPFLETSPDEIVNYLETNNVKWCEDSSNSTDHYLRNRIRHSIIPTLNEIDQRNEAGWKHTLQQLSASERLLESFLEKTEREIIRSSEKELRINKAKLSQTGEPRLLLNHLLDRYGFQMAFNELQFDQLLHQQPGKQFFSGDLQLINDREELILTTVPQEMVGAFHLEAGTEIDGWRCEEVDSSTLPIDSAHETLVAIPDGTFNFKVRIWQPGDSMQPIGFNGTKKVSDILTEMKVPLHRKKDFQVLVHNDHVVWIPGYRIADRYKITAQTKRAMRIIRNTP